MLTSVDFNAVVVALRAAGCVFAEDEARLIVDEAGSPERLREMVDTRVSGVPLEQVLGWAEFCGLRIVVEPGVFVPRRRTEYLVAQAVALARANAVVVDLCCGSGAIGAAIAATVADVDLYAADIAPAAVRCARRNLGGYSANVFEGDLFAALPPRLVGRVDVLTANVPYVPSEGVALMPPEARDYEPRDALDGGADGLDLARRVAADAAAWLAPGGHLLIEVSEQQADTAANMFARVGLKAAVVADDDLGATVVIGSLSGWLPG